MKRKLMICAMALCICAGLTGNTGEVSVWASEGSSSDACPDRRPERSDSNGNGAAS